MMVIANYDVLGNRRHGKIAWLLREFGAAQRKLSVFECFLTPGSPTTRPA